MGNADIRFRNSILDDDGIAPLIPSSRLPNNTRQGFRIVAHEGSPSRWEWDAEENESAHALGDYDARSVRLIDTP
jgi:hypothetical protein